VDFGTGEGRGEGETERVRGQQMGRVAADEVWEKIHAPAADSRVNGILQLVTTQHL